MVQLIAEGVAGILTFDGKKITIQRKGLLAFIGHGLKGNKSIMVGSISSIQFKNAGLLTNGYIQFAFHGGQEAKGGLFEGALDENTVVFRSKQQDAFKKIQEQLEIAIHAKHMPQTAASFSVADEIKKFSEMRDSGALSAQEFNEQKDRLLKDHSHFYDLMNHTFVDEASLDVPRKSIVGRGISWFFGVSLLLSSIGLFQMSFLGALLMMLAGLLLLPPVYTAIKKQDGTPKLPTWVRILIVSALLMSIQATIPNSAKDSAASLNQKSSHKKQREPYKLN